MSYYSTYSSIALVSVGVYWHNYKIIFTKWKQFSHFLSSFKPMKQQDHVCKKTETAILFLTLNVLQFAAASQAFTFQRSLQDTCAQQVGAGTPRWLQCSIRDLSITLCWTNCCHINYHCFSKKRENIYGVFFPLNKPIKLYVIAIKKQSCLQKNLQTDPEGQSTDWNFFFFSDFPVLREESRCS